MRLYKQDVRALAEEVVDGLCHYGFVSGNGRGGQYHRVSGDDLNVLVFPIGNSHQRRRWLALAAGGDDNDLLQR